MPATSRAPPRAPDAQDDHAPRAQPARAQRRGPSIRGRAVLLASAAALLLVTCVVGVAAQPRLDPSSQLRQEVAATRAAQTLDFHVTFRLDEARQVYLKVSPAPGNPVFGNGTANEDGWWTHVELEGPDGNLHEATTTGDPPIEFGTLEANTTYTLRLAVHAPAGALADPGNLTLEYVLAQTTPTSGSGSGGTLDLSVGLHAMLAVTGEPDEPTRAGPAPWLLLTLAIFVLLGLVVLLMAVRRGGRRPPSMGRKGLLPPSGG